MRFFNTLADCRMLQYLEVGSNPLNGVLPNSIGNLSSTIENFYIADAHISGFIPASTGNMSSLTTLLFHEINLTRSIPSEIGSFPLSFANLISLEFLDLSLNALSGTTPKCLEKLSYLKAIDVSFNDLEGEIPSGGVFANSTLQSFLGNKGLCGMHILEVPACPITNPRKQSKFKKLVLKFCYSSGYFILSDILVGVSLDKEMKEERKVQRC
ncbi:hypothetical protein HAX54_018211 [Datura stramonium]|uniref:Uncharacterized protein n=1 Tax=Datura stramonium TaxID=4076 RepID=A0ABS8UNH9_DATST|nr:hypothetical protein [Datura stramonium]